MDGRNQVPIIQTVVSGGKKTCQLHSRLVKGGKKKGSKRSHSEDFFLKLPKFYKARALILLNERQSSKILRSNKKDTSFLSSVLKVLPSYSLDFHSVRNSKVPSAIVFQCLHKSAVSDGEAFCSSPKRKKPTMEEID